MNTIQTFLVAIFVSLFCSSTAFAGEASEFGFSGTEVEMEFNPQLSQAKVKVIAGAVRVQTSGAKEAIAFAGEASELGYTGTEVETEINPQLSQAKVKVVSGSVRVQTPGTTEAIFLKEGETFTVPLGASRPTSMAFKEVGATTATQNRSCSLASNLPGDIAGLGLLVVALLAAGRHQQMVLRRVRPRR